MNNIKLFKRFLLEYNILYKTKLNNDYIKFYNRTNNIFMLIENNKDFFNQNLFDIINKQQNKSLIYLQLLYNKIYAINTFNKDIYNELLNFINLNENNKKLGQILYNKYYNLKTLYDKYNINLSFQNFISMNYNMIFPQTMDEILESIYQPKSTINGIFKMANDYIMLNKKL